MLLSLTLSLSFSVTSLAQVSVEEAKPETDQKVELIKTKAENEKFKEPITKEEASKGETDEPVVDKKEVSVVKKRKAVFLGHLLTPTTYLPEAKTITAGSHVIGYSVNDNLLVGTSSFLLFFYNSPNIYIKYGRQLSKKQRWSVQLDYLKSDESFTPFNTEYFMEAAMGWLSWSYDVTQFYTFHTSFNYMYFFNEGKPHSLRREPFNDDPFQFTLTTLHDVRVTENFGLASEIGVLGINYEVPNLHGAVSFRYIRDSFFIQVGVSFDAHVLRGGFDRRAYILNNPTLDASHTDDFVIHPEVAFQYFF
jgi:hypothetical protein